MAARPPVQQGADSQSGPALPGRLEGIATYSAAAPDHPGHWRRVLTITYAHLQGKEVRRNQERKGSGLRALERQRRNRASQRSFKSATAAQGLEMTDRAYGVHREVCRQEWIRQLPGEEQARMKRAAL